MHTDKDTLYMKHLVQVKGHQYSEKSGMNRDQDIS